MVTEPDLFHVAYVSAATKPMSTADLHALLARARDKNSRLGLTGMLAYADGRFLQVLEGRSRVVESVIDKIRADDRHEQMVVIDRAPIDRRSFSSWSMGFSYIERRQLPGVASFDDLLAQRAFASMPAELRARKLFEAFGARRWWMRFPDGWEGRSLLHPNDGAVAGRSRFRPIVNIASGDVFAYEANVQRPVSPPKHERSSSVHIVEMAAIEAAPAAVAAAGVIVPFLASSLLDEARVLTTVQTAMKAGLDPSKLIIELDAASDAVDMSLVAASLRTVRSLGVRICLANFGVGFAALDALETLRPEALSLAWALVANGREVGIRAAVVHGLVVTSTDLGCEVIAANVESSEVYRRLVDTGVKLFSGTQFCDASSVGDQVPRAFVPPR